MNTNYMSLHNTVSTPPPPGGASGNSHQPFSFYWGIESHFLFSGWPDNNSGMYASALILVFFLAILVEFFRNLNLVKPGSNRAAAIFFQAGIQAIKSGFGYMVILAIGSYNGGVFLVAILGHAVGFVIFGSRVVKKVLDED